LTLSREEGYAGGVEGEGTGSAAGVPRYGGAKVPKDEFFEDPVRAFWLDGADVPDAWIKEAWSADERFRDNATYEIVRSVSKVGGFSHARGWLEFLATFLSPEEVLRLFLSVRDGSGRPESEWRDEFEQAFASFVGHLPPPLPADE